MNKTSQYIVASIISVLMIIAATAYVYYKKNLAPDLTCTSYFQKTNNTPPHTFSLAASYDFSFKHDGSGIISAGGDIVFDNTNHSLNRRASVKIRPVQDGIWQIISIKEMKLAGDTTPDEVYLKYFYDQGKNSGRYFSIKKLNEKYWLIGSLRYPAFMCKNERE
ncbi:hypothetical protein F3J29_12805 [Enterobacter sp. Cy-643]|uniref:hypothetical protein n=1 Tax=Enterobacter sp. Cy-643 TaxID=2608346 RepID=UPI0014210DBB|nr:hypothetical protein [Enterobacter sp. Cy-643]NIF33010.1 hypothetical protein [Enterobacter sp. Cy-643]